MTFKSMNIIWPYCKMDLLHLFESKRAQRSSEPAAAAAAASSEQQRERATNNNNSKKNNRSHQQHNKNITNKRQDTRLIPCSATAVPLLLQLCNERGV